MRQASDHISQVISRQVGVDRGGVELGMTQKFLDIADVCVASYQMRRVAMAKSVDVSFDVRCDSVAFDALLDHHVRESLARLREPQRRRR